MPAYSNQTPLDVGIAVLAYSRPAHLQQVFDALRSLKVTRFTVFMDGADDHLIRKQQEVISQYVKNIDWADVEYVRRSINLGLRRSVVSAVSDMLEKYSAAIVLEDDCIPQRGFFEYMQQALVKYRDVRSVRSVCAYQFPHIASRSADVYGMCLSRFVPWGWATWRDRWVDYESNLRSLVHLADKSDVKRRLPGDIRQYIASKPAHDDRNDIWSINWILTHYLTNTLCMFPSRPLVRNIGFDGTGVHCVETDAFDKMIDDPDGGVSDIELPTVPVLDDQNDHKVTEYTQAHWIKTMVASVRDESVSANISPINVDHVTRSILDKAPIVDIHTHLFPPQHSEFHLSGLDELLTYHYLTAECLSVSEINPEQFFKRGKSERAECVWDVLFRNRTPMSEAAKGILTVLQHLGVEPGPEPYQKIKKAFEEHRVSDEKIFDDLNINKIIMTNDPCGPEEWTLFGHSDWDRKQYGAALRLDTLLLNSDVAAHRLAAAGKHDKADKPIGQAELRGLLDRWAEESHPEYVALSVDGNQLHDLLSDPLFTDALVPWLIQDGMPLALMVGVRRQVNPDFQEGGDGLGSPGLAEIETLCRRYPELRLLITHLHHNAQYELTVLARKLQNLKLFGFWWFNNQPSLITQTLRMRFDLLGMGFVPQHSDARVVEQLLFKWLHFKELLHDALVDRYRDLIRLGWPITEDTIQRDINALLHDNPAGVLKNRVDPPIGSVSDMHQLHRS